MDYLGSRFLKLGLIDHVGALSRLNYKNAMTYIDENILNIIGNSAEDRSLVPKRLSQLGQRLYELFNYRS